jgi:hypothetical protein
LSTPSRPRQRPCFACTSASLGTQGIAPSSNDNGSSNVTVLAVAIIVTAVGAIIITVATFAPLPGAVVAAAGTLFVLGALLVGGLSVREARDQNLSVLSVLGRASKRALGWFLAWLP